jgi:hypothetical protein
MKRIILALLAAIMVATPALAQVSPVRIFGRDSTGQDRPVTVTTDGKLQVDAAGAGGGSATPTGTAGSPNANVVTVQGISGGTAQNVQGTGTAGTPATGVITVQGIASGTPQNVTVATALPAGTNNIGGFVQRGGGTIATGQVSVGTTSTQIAAARTGRQRITMNVGAANACAFGNTGVTTTTGFALQPVAGASVTLDTAAAIFAACSATTTVSFIEQY